MTERESVFHDGGGAAWQWHAWIGMGMGWQDAAQRGWVGLGYHLHDHVTTDGRGHGLLRTLKVSSGGLCDHYRIRIAETLRLKPTDSACTAEQTLPHAAHECNSYFRSYRLFLDTGHGGYSNIPQSIS